MEFSMLMALPNRARWLARVETRASPVEVQMRQIYSTGAGLYIRLASLLFSYNGWIAVHCYMCICDVIQCFYSNIGCLEGMIPRGTLLDLVEPGRLLNLFHSQPPPFTSHTP